MLSKLFPRKLNHSADSKLRGKDDMSDAVNISVEGDDRGEDGGNENVIKPVKSNTALFGDAFTANNKTVLGKVTDDKYNVIYFFVWDANGSFGGVYAYDPDLYFSGHNADTIIRIYANQRLNFYVDSFINAEITYSQKKYSTSAISGVERDYEDVPFLFFTDNRNEPRKLNVLRAYYETSEQSAYGVPSIDDFITACPKAPVHPITFSWSSDLELPVSEFRGVNGFQFAYQSVFKDGNVSAISTYSEIAVPPSYINQGTDSSANLLAHNVCDLVIPSIDLTLEVDKVKVLARRGNMGSWFEITELENEDFNTDLTYSFNNTSVNIAVSKDDQIKQFDNLPKKAETQAIEGNRVFYGNYVEGFDDVPAEAKITPINKVRPQDFISYNVKLKPATCHSESVFQINQGSAEVINQPVKNKNSAFVIDTSELPDNTAIQQNDQFTLTFSILPDNNWHIYDAKDAYHQHNQLGDFFENDPNIDNEEFLQNYYWQNSVDSGQDNIANGPDSLDGGGGNLIPAQVKSGVVNSDSNGTAGNNIFEWNYVTGDVGSTSVTTRFGTSAANPLIVQAKPVSISLTLRANQPNITREDVSVAIAEALSEEALEGEYVNGSKFQVVDSDLATLYSYDLGLSNGSTFSMTDPLAKLIVMTGDNEFESGTLHGNFILNKATVQLGFFEDKAYTYNTGEDPTADSYYFGEGIYEDPDSEETNTDNRRVGIYIKQIYNVQALTCLRKGRPNSPWHVYDSDNIYGVTPSEDLDEGPFDEDYYPSLTDPFGSGGEFETHVGKLSFTDNLNDGKPFFKGTVAEAATSLSCFTVLDGKGGISGGPASLNGDLPYDNENVLVAPPLEYVFGISNLGSAPMQVSGPVFGAVFSGPIINNDARGFMPLHDNDGIVAPLANGSGIDISLQHSAALILGGSFFITSSQGDGERSFKSGANHAFGVVYYDYRGRASSVYPIGTAYAPAYYNRVDNNYGRIEMQINLLHSAPDWAKDFQIVYSGNTSISDFTQYTTGGAFYVESEDEAEDGNIYVSLNYLQENNDVSYTEAFGARSPEGASDMYTFKEGDLLRVISYYTSEDNRIFVDNRFLFEVAGQRTLSSGEDNPLFNEAEDADTAHPSKQGNFIILKNKPDADGFAYHDVQQGGNDPDTPAHNWNKRCVVEIISPSDSQAEDNIVFYETSKVFQIGEHNNSITMANGDVWWRRVPVNMPEFDGTFKNIILEEGSQPRFAPYYLETKAFNDTVRNADVTGEGKLKIVLPDAQESRRSTSITYSEKNNPASSVFQLTSFNPAKLQFKDLPIEHGNINYLLAQQDSLFVIQSDRCASVPVDRNIITTASSDQSLIAASKVLGTQRYYAGKYGCDNNPESVCAVGNNVYFASKSNSQVYRFNPSNGIEVISDKGMKSFFRRTFRDVISNQQSEGVAKIVGGYDPAKDEYIISIYNQSLADFTAVGGGAVNTGTPTSNALEEQLYQLIHSIVNVNIGQGALIGTNQLPTPLLHFYLYYTGNHNQDDSYLLDLQGDQNFTVDDVVSSAAMLTVLSIGAEAATTRIQNSTLLPIISQIGFSDSEANLDELQDSSSIANYIASRNYLIQDQKAEISALQNSLYGGEGFSIQDPSEGSALGQVTALTVALSDQAAVIGGLDAQILGLQQTISTDAAAAAAAASEAAGVATNLQSQIDSLTAQLSPFIGLGLSAGQIQAKLEQLQQIETVLTNNGFSTGINEITNIVTGYANYSSIGTAASFQNAINTLQALENVGVDMSEVYNLTTTAVFSPEYIQQVLSDGIADSSLETELSSELYAVLNNAGYSQNLEGLNALVADLDQWQNIGTTAGFGTNLSYNEVLDNLIKFNDFNSLGFSAAQLGDIIDVYDEYVSTGLSPTEIQAFKDLNLSPEQINGIVSELESYQAQGSVEDFAAFNNLEAQYGSLSAALSNLQEYLNINPNWTTHAEAQAELSSAYNNWNEWQAVSTAGFSSDDVVNILADYSTFSTSLGFDVQNGIFASDVVLNLQGQLSAAQTAEADAVAAQAAAEADLASAIAAQTSAEGVAAAAQAAQEAAETAQATAVAAANAAAGLQAAAEAQLNEATALAEQNLSALNSFASSLTQTETDYQSIATGIDNLAAVTAGWGNIILGDPAVPAEVSPWDLSQDNEVGSADLLLFLAQYGFSWDPENPPSILVDGELDGGAAWQALGDAGVLDVNADGQYEVGSAALLNFLTVYGETGTGGTEAGLNYQEALQAQFDAGVNSVALDEAGFATEILQLQTDLVNVGLTLGAHGWSPIDNLNQLDPNPLSEGSNTGQVDLLTPTQSASLAPAVGAALNELRTWTSAFRGSFQFYDEEGGGNEYFQYTLGSSTSGFGGVTAGTPVSWNDIINPNTMNPVAANALQGALEVVHENSPNMYNMYLPPSLYNIINDAGYDEGYAQGLTDGAGSGGGATYANLKDYIDANGITRDEYQRLVVAMQNLSEDGSAFRGSGFDTNNDSEIGSADLLAFLITYGATLDELGSASSTWLDPSHIYSPVMHG